MPVEFTDRTKMPFGAHKDKTLEEVPASYLLFLRGQSGWNKMSPLGRYIEDNLDVLQQQERRDKNLRR